MHTKPSVYARTLANKRAKDRNRAVGADKKRVSINLMDVLSAMDRMDARIRALEAELKRTQDY